MRRFVAAAVSTPLVLLSATSATADAVTDWNLKTVNAIRTAGLGPNPASRVLAITHIAIHDALAAVSHAYQPYKSNLAVQGPVSRDAATAEAAHRVLATLFPAQKSALDSSLQTALAAIPDGPEKVNGIALGDAAGDEILNLRALDGASSVVVPFTGSTDVGKWRPTPRQNPDAGAPLPGADPQWRTVTPFALTSPSQYRVAAPPALTSPQYWADFNEVKALGPFSGSTRTAEQTTIASFWAQATHVPINEIARTLSAQKGLTIDQSGYLFAVLNIALADSRVAIWDSKYFHNAWRPITAINLTPGALSPGDAGPADGGSDEASAEGGDAEPADGAFGDAAVEAAVSEGGGAGDAGPVGDPNWLPFLETPNHPEYPSGHSGTGAAGIQVLAAYFGDAVSFDVHSDSLANATRSFVSLAAVAAENGESRIYGGIHFRYANAASQDLGAKVGAYVLANELRPIAADAGTLDARADSTNPIDAGDASTLLDGASGDVAAQDASAPRDASADRGTAQDARVVADASDGGKGDATIFPDAPGAAPEDTTDCSCHLAHQGRTPTSTLLIAAGLGLAATWRRRKKSA